MTDRDSIFTHTCSRCGKIDSTSVMQKCSRCRAVFYCGVDCQTEDWPLHKGICKKKTPAAPIHVPIVVHDKASSLDSKLLDAVIRYSQIGPKAGRDGDKKSIVALIKAGANPSFVCPKSPVEPSERCALHIACLMTTPHPAAFISELLDMIGQSQVPLDWTRFSQLPVMPAAAATALGACLMASKPNPVAARWVLLRAGQGASTASAAGSPDSEALVLAGAKALRDVPCWVGSAHFRHDAPDVRLPIHAAAAAWDQSTLTALLEAGADVNALTSQGFSGALACDFASLASLSNYPPTRGANCSPRVGTASRGPRLH